MRPTGYVRFVRNTPCRFFILFCYYVIFFFFFLLVSYNTLSTRGARVRGSRSSLVRAPSGGRPVHHKPIVTAAHTRSKLKGLRSLCAHGRDNGTGITKRPDQRRPYFYIYIYMYGIHYIPRSKYTRTHRVFRSEDDARRSAVFASDENIQPLVRPEQSNATRYGSPVTATVGYGVCFSLDLVEYRIRTTIGSSGHNGGGGKG